MDWGDWGSLPSHIWCFVDLEALNLDIPKIEFGGVMVKPGMCAVVETAILEENNGDESIQTEGLHTPILKDDVVADADGFVKKWVFYLVDAAAFEEPCCIVPDIGGPMNSHFVVCPRREWMSVFTMWLEAPHKDDGDMQMSDDEE